MQKNILPKYIEHDEIDLKVKDQFKYPNERPIIIQATFRGCYPLGENPFDGKIIYEFANETLHDYRFVYFIKTNMGGLRKFLRNPKTTPHMRYSISILEKRKRNIQAKL